VSAVFAKVIKMTKLFEECAKSRNCIESVKIPMSTAIYNLKNLLKFLAGKFKSS
jgi:hypothetical protein